MPNINIDDAYILGETGAQVDKVTGLFTKDENTTNPEKAFAQLNIGTAGSNRNLLDNPWWGSGEAVNQRNTQSKPSNGSYTIDRWILTSGADANQWAIGTNGITFTIASSNIWYMQIIPNISSLFGKTLTASVMFGDGTIKSGTATLTSSASATFWGDTQSNVSLNTAGTFQFTVRATQTIHAVKLELGSVSTLANDAPPKFWSEWTECRRYFKRFKAYSAVLAAIGVCTSTTNAQFVFGDEPMAKDTVTAAYSGDLTVQSGDGSTHAISAISASTTKGGGVVVSVTSSGLVAGDSARLRINTTESYLDLSAEL